MPMPVAVRDEARRHVALFCDNRVPVDVRGVVHSARRLLEETDGPMLRAGLQGFHGKGIALPRRPEHRPDPLRLVSIRTVRARGGVRGRNSAVSGSILSAWM
jgi:hypothetical protein